MGTTLTGTTPQDTYDSLIKVTDNGPISGTLKALSDGLGNDSALALSTGAATITGTLTTTAKTLAERVQVGTAASLNDATGVGNTLQFANYSPSVFVTGSADSYIYKNSSVFGNLAAQSLVFQTRSDTTGGGFAFVAGGTPAVVATITGAGNVGIGTATPSTSLEVVKNDAVTNDSTNALDITHTSSGTTANGFGVGLGFFIENSTYSTLNEVGRIEVVETDQTTLTDAMVFYTKTNNVLTEKIRIIPTGGITFNGDTAAANALDDYEEGTFTPTIAGSTTAGTATYTTQVGRYTKIGRQVSCQIDLGYNSGTGTGDLTVTGLPFADTTSANPAATIGYLDGITLTALNYAMAYLASTTTRIDFVQIPTGGGALTSVAYDAAGRIILNVTYTA
jgi:hypothetical protein